MKSKAEMEVFITYFLRNVTPSITYFALTLIYF